MRCILPNNDKQCGNFDEQLILEQLNTSCVMSYARFMRFGFSKRIDFKELVDKCKPIEDKLNTAHMDRSQFYSKILLCIGFTFGEFKIGNDAIFFRSNKFELLETFFSNISTHLDMTSVPSYPK